MEETKPDSQKSPEQLIKERDEAREQLRLKTAEVEHSPKWKLAFLSLLSVYVIHAISMTGALSDKEEEKRSAEQSLDILISYIEKMGQTEEVTDGIDEDLEEIDQTIDMIEETLRSIK